MAFTAATRQTPVVIMKGGCLVGLRQWLHGLVRQRKLKKAMTADKNHTSLVHEPEQQNLLIAIENNIDNNSLPAAVLNPSDIIKSTTAVFSMPNLGEGELRRSSTNNNTAAAPPVLESSVSEVLLKFEMEPIQHENKSVQKQTSNVSSVVGKSSMVTGSMSLLRRRWSMPDVLSPVDNKTDLQLNITTGENKENPTVSEAEALKRERRAQRKAAKQRAKEANLATSLTAALNQVHNTTNETTFPSNVPSTLLERPWSRSETQLKQQTSESTTEAAPLKRESSHSRQLSYKSNASLYHSGEAVTLQGIMTSAGPTGSITLKSSLRRLSAGPSTHNVKLIEQEKLEKQLEGDDATSVSNVNSNVNSSSLTVDATSSSIFPSSLSASEWPTSAGEIPTAFSNPLQTTSTSPMISLTMDADQVVMSSEGVAVTFVATPSGVIAVPVTSTISSTNSGSIAKRPKRSKQQPQPFEPALPPVESSRRNSSNATTRRHSVVGVPHEFSFSGTQEKEKKQNNSVEWKNSNTPVNAWTDSGHAMSERVPSDPNRVRASSTAPSSDDSAVQETNAAHRNRHNARTATTNSTNTSDDSSAASSISMTHNNTTNANAALPAIQNMAPVMPLQAKPTRHRRQSIGAYVTPQYNAVVVDPVTAKAKEARHAMRELLTTATGATAMLEFERQLKREMRTVQFPAGHFIIRKNTIGTEMYFLSKGTVQVCSSDAQQIYSTIHAGSFFGELGVLFRVPRTASVRAVEECTCQVLTRDALEKTLQGYPVIAERFRQLAESRMLQVTTARAALRRNRPVSTATAAAMLTGPSLVKDGVPNMHVVEEEEAEEDETSQIQLTASGPTLLST